MLVQLAHAGCTPQCHQCCQSSSLHSSPFVPLFQDAGLISVIYQGSLQAGWLSASYGCLDCNWADQNRHRSVSSASIYAQIAPWAAFILQSDTPFSGDRREAPPWHGGGSDS